MRGRLGSPVSRSALPGNELASSERRSRRMVLSRDESRLWCPPVVLTLSCTITLLASVPRRSRFGGPDATERY